MNANASTSSAPSGSVTQYRTALFGNPISQSLAPTFHSACYRARNLQSTGGAPPTAEQLQLQRRQQMNTQELQHWTCELQETKDFDHFLQWSGRAPGSTSASSSGKKFGGAAITMPYKSVVLQHVDEIDDEARLIGAANTVYWRGSALVATNVSRGSFSRISENNSR